MTQLIDYKENEAQTLKEYAMQLRQELGSRLSNIMFNEEGQNPVFKLWSMYSKKKFMSLSYP